MHIALKWMRYGQSARPNLFPHSDRLHVLLQSCCFPLVKEINWLTFFHPKCFRPSYHFLGASLWYLMIQIFYSHFPCVSEQNQFSRLQFWTCTAHYSLQQIRHRHGTIVFSGFQPACCPLLLHSITQSLWILLRFTSCSTVNTQMQQNIRTKTKIRDWWYDRLCYYCLLLTNLLNCKVLH